MRNSYKVVFIMIMILQLTGCMADVSIEDKLRPPKLTIELEEIKKCIQDNINDDIELVISKYNKNMQLINLIDLDNDNKKEAVLLYKNKKKRLNLGIIILKNINGKWNLFDIKGIGNDIGKIQFYDINNDGTLEIFVTWVGGMIDNEFEIYSLTKDGVKSIFKKMVMNWLLDDLDGDGRKELFLVKEERQIENPDTQLEMYKSKDNQLILADSCKMECFINGVGNMFIGYAKEGVKGLFMDIVVGAHSAYTDLVILKNDKLYNVFFDEKEGVTGETFKPYMRFSRDIDNDGIIEIPLLKESKGYENASMVDTPWITYWYKWDGLNSINFIKRTYEDYEVNSVFNFPVKWDDNIKIYKSNYYDNIKYTTFSYVEGDREEKLFTIYAMDSKTWQKNKNYDYKVIGKSFKYIFSVKMYSLPKNKKARKMFLTLEEIKKLFHCK